MTGHWSQLALCSEVGGDMWFPDKGESTRDAKVICGMCEVKAQCLAFALAWPEELVGVWGGTSVTERRRLRGRGVGKHGLWADVKPCGTLAAYKRHSRRGEEPCAECRRANADATYSRERRIRAKKEAAA